MIRVGGLAGEILDSFLLLLFNATLFMFVYFLVFMFLRSLLHLTKTNREGFAAVGAIHLIQLFVDSVFDVGFQVHPFPILFISKTGPSLFLNSRFRGLTIAIPHFLPVYVVVFNLATLCTVYIVAKFYLCLSGRQLYLFCLLMGFLSTIWRVGFGGS